MGSCLGLAVVRRWRIRASFRIILGSLVLGAGSFLEGYVVWGWWSVVAEGVVSSLGWWCRELQGLINFDGGF